MASLNRNCRIISGKKIDRLLLLGDGGRGLDSTAEHNRHAGGYTAVDTAVMIGHRTDAAILHPKSVIAATAAHIRHGKSGAEFHALDTADGKQRMG